MQLYDTLITKPEMKPEMKPETKLEMKPEMKPETKLEMKLKMKPETNLKTNPDTKSVNEILFADIKPMLLRVWLEPLPPTAVMKELNQFQKHFKDCSENQQLLIISQMVSFDPPIEADACNIHVHRSVHASSFLKDWQEDVKKIGAPRKTAKRYHRYVTQLSLLLEQLTMDRMCDLVITMMQISQCSITQNMHVIYGVLTHGVTYEKHELIWEHLPPILPPVERAILIAEMSKSSCPITRQVMVLHLQLERQMMLYLQQLREQLYQRIEMQLELEKLIQYEIAALQEE